MIGQTNEKTGKRRLQLYIYVKPREVLTELTGKDKLYTGIVDWWFAGAGAKIWHQKTTFFYFFDTYPKIR